MRNSTEKFRIEPTDEAQGGWVYFDWADGTMRAVWDDGCVETWRRNGYDIEAKAKSFLLFTGQTERYLAAVS